MITYIYTLTDPITNKIRYVGKTTRPLTREVEHCNITTAQKRLNKKNCWCLSLLKRGYKPIFTIIDKTDGDWEALEIKYIKYFQDIGCDLVNDSIGGGSANGRTLTEHTKSLISINNANKNLTDEEIIKICVLINKNEPYVNIKRLFDKLSIRTYRRIIKGESFQRVTSGLITYHSTNLADKKPVYQLDGAGNVIKEYESISSAARAIGKSTASVSCYVKQNKFFSLKNLPVI